jgi:hypothetical protein
LAVLARVVGREKDEDDSSGFKLREDFRKRGLLGLEDHEFTGRGFWFGLFVAGHGFSYRD